MAKLSSKQLGDKGENDLSSWLLAEGITFNRSLDADEYGWDHYVEFPSSECALPRDLAPPPIKCKIQVKANQSVSAKKSCQIKLSALKHLVDDPLPTFLLFLWYSKESPVRLKSIHLVHIDGQRIGRILQLIRENDTSTSRKELHKLKPSINYDKSEELSFTHGSEGAAIKDSIFQCIPNGLDAYIKQKRRQVESVGYENGRYHTSFIVHNDEYKRYFIDSLLGEKTRLKVSNFELRDVRFDSYDTSVLLNQMDVGYVELEPGEAQRKPAELILKMDGFPQIKLMAELFSPPPGLEDRIVYLKTSILVLAFDFDPDAGLKISFNGDLSKLVPLDDLTRHLRMLGTDRVNKPWRMEVHVKGKSVFKLKNMYLNFDYTYPPGVADSILVIKNIFDIYGDTLTAVTELADNPDEIYLFEAIVNREVKGITVNIEWEQIYAIEPNKDYLLLPFCPTIRLGESYYSAMALVRCDIISDGQVEMKTVECIEFHQFNDQKPTDDELNKLVESVESRFTEKLQ